MFLFVFELFKTKRLRSGKIINLWPIVLLQIFLSRNNLNNSVIIFILDIKIKKIYDNIELRILVIRNRSGKKLNII